MVITNPEPRTIVAAAIIVILGSFLLAFKAVLVEGSEVAILSLATIRQLGRDNVLAGVLLGGAGSVAVFLVVRQAFVLLPDSIINIGTGVVILYFSSRFLRGFAKYYFGGKSFRDKMQRVEDEVVEKEMARYGAKRPEKVPFSLPNSLPVLSITLTEGFEASLVVAAAGAFNFEWTVVGALASIALLIAICAVSYEYLLRFPRWALDALAGTVLLVFGSYFLISGLLMVL